jgi:hypothetical protein
MEVVAVLVDSAAVAAASVTFAELPESTGAGSDGGEPPAASESGVARWVFGLAALLSTLRSQPV